MKVTIDDKKYIISGSTHKYIEDRPETLFVGLHKSLKVTLTLLAANSEKVKVKCRLQIKGKDFFLSSTDPNLYKAIGRL